MTIYELLNIIGYFINILRSGVSANKVAWVVQFEIVAVPVLFVILILIRPRRIDEIGIIGICNKCHVPYKERKVKYRTQTKVGEDRFGNTQYIEESKWFWEIYCPRCGYIKKPEEMK